MRSRTFRNFSGRRSTLSLFKIKKEEFKKRLEKMGVGRVYGGLSGRWVTKSKLFFQIPVSVGWLGSTLSFLFFLQTATAQIFYTDRRLQLSQITWCHFLGNAGEAERKLYSVWAVNVCVCVCAWCAHLCFLSAVSTSWKINVSSQLARPPTCVKIMCVGKENRLN